MAAVSEWIVREYFETLGFLVAQPRKYQVSARSKRAEEEIDLLVVNPLADRHETGEAMLWGAAELHRVARAVVGVRGWFTDRFTPSVLKISPEVVRFAEEPVLKKASEILGEGPVAKVLCIPELPASDELREETLKQLRERGIDGVLLFRTMLRELAATVEVSRNYDKSDLLQLLRILKSYDMLRDAQMELFRPKRRKE